MTDNDDCDCPMCRINRLVEIVKNLVERVSLLEELRLLDIEGDVNEDGKVNWRNKDES